MCSRPLAVWIVLEVIPGSGNLTTAEKMASFLSSSSSSFTTEIVDRSEVLGKAAAAESSLPALIIAIHALKSALPIVAATAGAEIGLGVGLGSIPLIVLLSGTDMAPATCEDAVKVAALRRVFESPQVKQVVAISSPIAKAYERLFVSSTQPGAAAAVAPCFYLPQSVDTGEGRSDSGEKGCCSRPTTSLREACGFPNNGKVALLVAGIRAVKDPGFLVSAISEEKDFPLSLAIVGPPLDPGLLETALLRKGVVDRRAGARAHAGSVDTFAESPRCFYLGAVPRALLLLWIHECDVLVNTSLSEGQSNAILEAATLGTPVVARDVPGNRSLLMPHEAAETGEPKPLGFLFTTPAEALTMLRQACLRLDDVPARIQRAKAHMARYHSREAEEQAWLKIVDSVLRPSESLV